MSSLVRIELTTERCFMSFDISVYNTLNAISCDLALRIIKSDYEIFTGTF